MIKEIEAKGILTHYRTPDPWFGLKYNMNLYRGCPHQCIYCDSRSECYRIENFQDVLVKVNGVELLKRELATKRHKGTIGTGSMNDPYSPVERQYNLVGSALQVIAEHRFPVHIITKSDLVTRDVDTIREIGKVYAAVSFTVTTVDDELALRIEPGAPPPSARLQAMETLAAAGIYTGVTMMPLLPYICDSEENIRGIAERAHAAGARYIIPWFGMSLRDQQRAYYYRALDRLFPGLRKQYEARFGNQYNCVCNDAYRLEQLLISLGRSYGIQLRMDHYSPEEAGQMSLFGDGPIQQ